MPEERPGEFAISFIDPLFAVAIHLGLSHGLFVEPWFISFRAPKGIEIFDIFSFGLGVLTLVLAWVGYHKSIKRRPTRAFGRFIIDIVLVTLYAALMVKFHDLSACLFLLIVIYILYSAWDLLKVIEYHEDYRGSGGWARQYGREFITCLWLCVFIVIYWAFQGDRIGPGAALLSAYIATILHRINKAVPIWTALGQTMSRLFLHGKSSGQA